jgi:hypothetical protein
LCGIYNPWYGKKLSDEVKLKISITKQAKGVQLKDVKDLHNHGLSVPLMAEKLKCSRYTIFNRLKKLNLKSNVGRIDISDEDIVELRDCGMSYEQIGKKLGFGSTTAKDRLKNALIVSDENKEVVIGRPQLDLLNKPMNVNTERKILVYAPTWEGDQDANNYSSVDVYGEQIVSAMLKIPNSTLIYKPHPKVITSPKPSMMRAHKAVMSLLDSANSKDPSAKHMLVAGDPLPVLQVADLLVSDVSAVTIDYLYLKPQGAMLMCDRRSNEKEFAEIAPVSKAVTVINNNNISNIEKLISDHVAGQVDRSSYESMRNYYFGDTKPGSSITRFISMVDDLIKRRDNRVSQLPTSN